MELTDLVSIDPGVNQIWWAAWSPNYKLHRVGRLKVKSAFQVANYLSQFKGAVLAIERPIIGRGGRFGQARPDDILRLAISVGWCEAAPWLEVCRYKPAEWKGGVSKVVGNNRVLRAMSHAEKAVLEQAKIPASLKHNAIDAIGIGVHFLRSKGLRE